MSLWNKLKQHAGAQFLEVIDWMDDSNDTIVYRYPTFNQAITDNSKLVIREGQAGVFVAEGKLSEVFAPGTYPLDTRNKPLMRFFQSIAYKLEEPYKGDIYFVSTRQFIDNGWGTATPIMMRDAEFGPVRIRAYGIYTFRVTDPGLFLQQIVGTDGLFTTDEITGQLKRKLIGALAQTIGKSRIAVLDLAASYMDLGDQLRDDINPSFSESYGISLTDFTIQSISLPEEVEKALDTRSKMGILGDLNAYTKLKAAEAIEIAAANPGMGGLGASMGVGFGLGNQIGGNMMGAQGQGPFNPHQGMQGQPAPMPPPPPTDTLWHYHGPTGQAQLSAADVASRIVGDRSASHKLWKPGFAGWLSWDEVPEIAGMLPPPTAAPPPLPGQATFHYNGPGGQGEKSVAEIVAAVQADPGARHHVWQSGWDGWKAAADVPEIASELGGGDAPPPLPG